MKCFIEHLGDPWNLQNGFTNLAAVLQFPKIFRETLTKFRNNSTNCNIFLEKHRQMVKKICQICKDVSNNIDELKNLHLACGSPRRKQKISKKRCPHLHIHLGDSRNLQDVLL